MFRDPLRNGRATGGVEIMLLDAYVQGLFWGAAGDQHVHDIAQARTEDLSSSLNEGLGALVKVMSGVPRVRLTGAIKAYCCSQGLEHPKYQIFL